MTRRSLALPLICLLLAACNNIFHMLASDDPNDKYLTVVGGDGYRVRFHKNGGDTEAIPNIMIVKGEAIYIESLPAEPTWNLHAFTGWNTMADGSGDEFTEETPVEQSLTVYAQWRADSVTVTFDTNGGEGEPPSSKTVEANSNIVLPGDDGFSLDGNDFAGWNTDSDGSGITYKAYDPFPVTGDITLYAKWNSPGVKTFTVSFDSRGGSPAGSQIVNEGETARQPDNPGRKGYTFDRWYSDPGLIAEYIFSAPVTADITLHADWHPVTYKVAYNANGGSGTMADSVHIYDIEKALTPNGYTRDDYTFVGWNTRADGSSARNFADGEKVSNLSETDGDTFTLFAKWLEVPPGSFAVVFNANGGTIPPKVQTVSAGERVSEPSAMTRPGHAFDGWYKEEAFISKWIFAADTVAENTTLYAKWDPVAYTVRYDPNDGKYEGAAEGAMAPSSHTYGVEKSLTLNEFTRVGYTFSKWATGTDGGNFYYDGAVVQDLSAVNDSVVTLYALWDPIAYTVKYDANAAGATGTTDDSRHTYGAERALTRNGFTLEGFKFDGWAATPGGAVVYNDGENVKNLTAADDAVITLYAQWTPVHYTVTYNANGGSGSMPPSDHVYNEPKNLDANAFTRTGYKFDGWASQTDGGGTSFADEEEVNNLCKSPGTYTVYAKWIAITYTVSYDPNGGSGDMTPSNHVYGEPKNLTINSFTLTDYIFTGWALSSGGSVVYGDGVSVTNLTETDGANITLYAKWAVFRTVTFMPDGGSPAPASQTVADGGFATEPSRMTKADSYFDGWYKESTLDNIWNFYSDIVTGSDITLHAKWIPAFTITFDRNNATGGTAPDSMTTGDGYTITIPNQNTLSRPGYAFGGWNTKDDGSGTNYSANDPYIVTDNATLYANWIANSHTVTFNKNNGDAGSTEASPQTMIVTSPATNVGSLPTQPERSGYTFNGWYTQASGGTVFTELTTVDEDITVYARWAPITYTITFNKNNGDPGSTDAVPGTRTVTSPATTISAMPSSPTRVGYIFVNWNTDEYGDGQTFTDGTTVTNSFTVYAQWTLATYAVTFNKNYVDVGNPDADTIILPVTYPFFIDILPVAIRANHTFLEWNTEPGGKGSKFDETTMVTGGITVYAQWSD